MTDHTRSGWITPLVVAWLAACVMPSPWSGKSEAEWKRRASELRDLEFLSSVQFEYVTTTDLTVRLDKESGLDLDIEKLERRAHAWVALGLLPPDIKLPRNVAQGLGPLAGLYVAPMRSLFILVDRHGSEFSTGQTIVHELVHALQHQHFPATVEAMHAVESNEDLMLALRATIEGDAQLTMLDSDTSDPWGRDVEDARIMAQLLLGDLWKPPLESVDAAPEQPGLTVAQRSRGVADDELASMTGGYAGIDVRADRAHWPLMIRMTRVFPYSHGMVFAALAYAQDANRSLDAQLQDPPLSTRQVRFPDAREPVDFLKLPLEALGEALESRSCRLGHHDVAGALAIEMLLDEYVVSGADQRMVRAWKGDRYVHFSCPEGGELAWLTHWNDEEAARSFGSLYAEAAPRIAVGRPISGTPGVHRAGARVVIVTPGLADYVALLLDSSEARTYSRFAEWRADRCFPASACPEPPTEGDAAQSP